MPKSVKAWRIFIIFRRNKNTTSNGNLGGHGQRGRADKTGSNAGGFGDTGGASRFFYCAKSSKKDRHCSINNTHPTVKPTDLMKYLCRLITPPNGIVLDPFMGSGSTGKAACLEGFSFIGMELDKDYFNIAESRLLKAQGLDFLL